MVYQPQVFCQENYPGEYHYPNHCLRYIGVRILFSQQIVYTTNQHFHYSWRLSKIWWLHIWLKPRIMPTPREREKLCAISAWRKGGKLIWGLSRLWRRNLLSKNLMQRISLQRRVAAYSCTRCPGSNDQHRLKGKKYRAAHENWSGGPLASTLSSSLSIPIEVMKPNQSPHSHLRDHSYSLSTKVWAIRSRRQQYEVSLLRSGHTWDKTRRWAWEMFHLARQVVGHTDLKPQLQHSITFPVQANWRMTHDIILRPLPTFDTYLQAEWSLSRWSIPRYEWSIYVWFACDYSNQGFIKCSLATADFTIQYSKFSSTTRYRSPSSNHLDIYIL